MLPTESSQVPFGESLRAELGRPRRARKLGSSPRSRVWRAELSGTPVVIKQLVEAPEADERYAREVAALKLAARVESPVVPMLLGTDPEERVLVLEHLEEREPRENWIVDYAGALARLHSAVGVDAGAGAPAALPAWSGPTRGDIDSFLELARRLGAEPPSAVRTELESLVDRLATAPVNALLHGDPCPGNDMHTAEGVRFIDFEQAALGNGLVELAYLRIGFPTCWCVTTTPPSVLDEAEAAYRSAWRAATGAELSGDLADACGGWLIRGDALVQRAERGAADYLAAIPERDWKWGTVTARERLVHRLGVVSRITVDVGELAGLGRLAADLRAAMLSRWPELQPPPVRRPW